MLMEMCNGLLSAHPSCYGQASTKTIELSKIDISVSGVFYILNCQRGIRSSSYIQSTVESLWFSHKYTSTTVSSRILCGDQMKLILLTMLFAVIRFPLVWLLERQTKAISMRVCVCASSVCAAKTNHTNLQLRQSFIYKKKTTMYFISYIAVLFACTFYLYVRSVAFRINAWNKRP